MTASAAGRLALAAALLAPSGASAQGRLSTKLSASISEVYDGNLFAESEPRADLISRAGPLFELGFRTMPFDVTGRYEIQAERYLNNPELNAAASHHDARLAIRYTPDPRFDLMIDSTYLETQSPAELNLVSGIGVGRARAERFGATAVVGYHLQPLTVVTSEYSFGHDAIAGGVSSTAQSWRGGVEQRVGPRNAYRLDYRMRRTDFDGGASVQSHAFTAGWDHSLTSRTHLEVSAGPRLTEEGSIRPEIAASVRRNLTRGELSISYSSTELTAIGERGTIDVHRAAVTGHYRPWRRVDVGVTPAYVRSARGRDRVPVFSLDAESSVLFGRRFAVTGWARVGRQHGTLSGSTAVIPYRGLGLKLRVAVSPEDAGPR